MSWRINLLVYDGCYGFETFAVADVLAIANRVSLQLRPGVPAPFRTRLVSVRGTRVHLNGGTTVDAHRADRRTVDQLVVPGFECADAATLGDRLAGWAPEVRFLR